MTRDRRVRTVRSARQALRVVLLRMILHLYRLLSLGVYIHSATYYISICSFLVYAYKFTFVPGSGMSMHLGSSEAFPAHVARWEIYFGKIFAGLRYVPIWT